MVRCLGFQIQAGVVDTSEASVHESSGPSFAKGKPEMQEGEGVGDY